jgi:hypothetical protein
MGRSDGTRIGIGGTLVGLGGAGMIALLIYAAEAGGGNQPSPWGQTWFQSIFSVSAFFAALGAYVLLSVWFPLPLWATRSEREFQPRLEGTEAHVRKAYGNHVIFQIGTYNAGRGNVDGAIVNVIVPEFATELHRSTEDGEIGRESTRERGHVPPKHYLRASRTLPPFTGTGTSASPAASIASCTSMR